MRLKQISQTKLALGGDIKLTVIADKPTLEVERLFRRMWRQVFSFERRFSRFLPMSELSLFNRSSGLKNPISPEFRNLLIVAKQLGEKTNGLFNPFIMPALQNIGYLKSAVSGYEHDTQTDYTNRRVVSFDHLAIGDDWASIPFGTAIDLGGCGKGYLADQLAKTFDEQQIQCYWMSLGGDVASRGRDENGELLTIAIQDANNLTNTVKRIIECPEGYFSIATSGTFQRKSHNVGEQWHHIIDPSTLKSAVTDIRLATVCADRAVDADVLASCAIILGSQKALKFLKENGAKSALLQCNDKKGDNFEIMFGDNIKKQKRIKTLKYLRTRRVLLLIPVLIVGLVLISILFIPTIAHSGTKPGSIVVQTIPGQTLAQQIIGRIQTTWPWYLVRGSGLLAALSLVILILSGLGSVTGQTFKFLEPITAWASHRALGIVFGVSVLIHMAGLLFDHFVSFDLMTLLVPWLSSYKPVIVFGMQLGSLYVALGVLAFYGAAIIVITSLLWVEKKPYIWKLLHLLSYFVLTFVFIHALYLGTDLASGFLRWLWIAIGVGGVGLIVYRLWRSRTV